MDSFAEAYVAFLGNTFCMSKPKRIVKYHFWINWSVWVMHKTNKSKAHLFSHPFVLKLFEGTIKTQALLATILNKRLRRDIIKYDINNILSHQAKQTNPRIRQNLSVLLLKIVVYSHKSNSKNDLFKLLWNAIYVKSIGG